MTSLSGTSFTHSLLCEEDYPLMWRLYIINLLLIAQSPSDCKDVSCFKIQEMSCRCIFEGAPVNIISIQGALRALHDCWWWPMHNDVKIGKLATWSVRGLHDFHDVFCSFSARNTPTRGAHGCQYDPQVRFSNRKGSKSLGSSEFPPRWEAAETTLPISPLTFLRRETTPFQGQFLQVKLRATVGKLPDKTGRKIIR